LTFSVIDHVYQITIVNFMEMIIKLKLFQCSGVTVPTDQLLTSTG
jgi:hypothetical protein